MAGDEGTEMEDDTEQRSSRPEPGVLTFTAPYFSPSVLRPAFKDRDRSRCFQERQAAPAAVRRNEST